MHLYVEAPRTLEYVPLSQFLQVKGPMLGLYLPAAQATHNCRGPVLPASHKHAATSLLRATECEF
jgi:hypothetical protein